MDDEVYVEPEKQLEKLTKSQKRDRAGEDEDLDWVLSDPRGRRYVAKVGNLKSIFSTNPMVANTAYTAHNCGSLMHAQTIINEVLTRRPELFTVMISEMLSDQKEKEHERRNNG